MKTGKTTKYSAREELEQKLDDIVKEKTNLVKNYHPDELPERYYALVARQYNLEEYLQEHDDEYIEKDRAFDRGKCPIAAPYNEEWGGFEPSLKESGDFIEPCKHEDCPEYSECWATRSIEPPVSGLGAIDDEEDED